MEDCQKKKNCNINQKQHQQRSVYKERQSNKKQRNKKKRKVTGKTLTNLRVGAERSSNWEREPKKREHNYQMEMDKG